MNKKNIDNYQKQENMAETMEAQLYQWLKTDKAGDYVYEDKIEEEDGITYIKFTDGSQVNAELLGEYVIKVDSEDDGFDIKEEIIHDMTKAKLQDGGEVEIPGVMHGQKKVTMVKKPGGKRKKPTPPPTKMVREGEKPKPAVATDPVIILLEKAKKEKHTYDIELNVDAISTQLFGVVKDTFDDGEEKALDYIVSLIDMDKLKEQLKEKLKEVYNGEGNNTPD